MSSGTLYDKVWDLHRVANLPGGSTQLLIGLHLIHEVTSPQAFAALEDKGLPVRCPERTVATVDHIVPTTSQARPFADPLAEEMLSTLERNCERHGITLHGLGSGRQGIVHVIAPELGLTQPGMTVACGDSHTSTHGAFGAIAFGIGTSQVRDVLASQSLAMNKLKVRRLWFGNQLSAGVFAKDLILHVIRTLGVKAGVGHAYEFASPAIEPLSMEERMTLCNMAIEGGPLRLRQPVRSLSITWKAARKRRVARLGSGLCSGGVRWPQILMLTSTMKCALTLPRCPTVTWGITLGRASVWMKRSPRLSSWIPPIVRSRRRPTATWTWPPAPPLRVFLWMCVSSAVAPTAVSVICRRQPAWLEAGKWRLASGVRRAWIGAGGPCRRSRGSGRDPALQI